MLPPISHLLDPKKILRERMKAERRIAAKARPDARRHAASNFMTAFDEALSDTNTLVSLYFPIKNELDTEPLAAALTENETAMCLPVVAARKSPLTFRAYQPGDPMIEGNYGELVPTEGAAIVRPTIIVVPLLAFTPEGGRLGYGGGYYDRTLELLRADGPVTAVGYGYGAQEVDALPLTRLDQPLDWVVTERRATRCR